MSHEPGSTIGPYTISGKLGAGGMGEVYRASDPKLRRDVAIKLLPQSFLQDAERLARFEREAHLLAQLQHPNIATIFGFEESGDSRALVMELVEGPTLEERLTAAPVSVDDAIEIMRQVAEALEEAHAKGIVHRDLKPANIKAAQDGRVKVLDFGLAKALDPTPENDGATPASLLHSPTVTSAGSQLGVILGTASYMSPEQARGVTADRRADIWAFGVVFYELLTGKRLFAGEMVSDVLAGVLKGDIDLEALPAAVPSKIRHLLRRCLQRNPRQRLHDIADARIVLEEVLRGEDDASTTPQSAAPAASRLGWLVAGVALLALIASLVIPRTAPEQTSSTSLALQLASPNDGQFLIGSNTGWGALSPDGRHVVVRSLTEGKNALWVRPLDAQQGRLLPQTSTGFYPFWSPDSRHVAYFTFGQLMRVELEGGLPEKICDADWGRGGSWSHTGEIVFTPVGGGSIHLVAAAGGEPRQITEVDLTRGEDAHYWPVWLPDGKRFLYFIRSTRREDQGIYLGQVPESGIDTARRRIVASSSSGILAPTPDGGTSLLWVQDGTVLSRRFDIDTGEVVGNVSRIAESVRVLESQRAIMASASDNGTLMWADDLYGSRKLVSFDAQGNGPRTLLDSNSNLHQPTLSPDGSLVSFVSVEGGHGDIWVYDLRSRTARQLSSSQDYEESVCWSPDSKRLLFRGGGAKGSSFNMVPADGSAAPQRIWEEQDSKDTASTNVFAWLPGDWLVVSVHDPDGNSAIGTMHLDARDPKVLVSHAGDQFAAILSPTGDAMVYASDENGQVEGYLVSLGTEDGRPVVTSNRQRVPVDDMRLVTWSKDGNTLYFMTSAGLILQAPVSRSQGTASIGAVSTLFAVPSAMFSNRFGVTENAEDFIFVLDPQIAHQPLQILHNWASRAQVP